MKQIEIPQDIRRRLQMSLSSRELDYLTEKFNEFEQLCHKVEQLERKIEEKDELLLNLYRNTAKQPQQERNPEIGYAYRQAMKEKQEKDTIRDEERYRTYYHHRPWEYDEELNRREYFNPEYRRGGSRSELNERKGTKMREETRYVPETIPKRRIIPIHDEDRRGTRNEADGNETTNE